MNIHPFSRQFSGPGDSGGIEARIELRDHFGDTVKGYGTYLFEAYHLQDRSADGRGKRMAFWSIDISDPAANFEHWDSLSRTYKFVLDWRTPKPEAGRIRLEATFNPPEGYGKRLFSGRELPRADKQ